jgi:hypothetical protein
MRASRIVLLLGAIVALAFAGACSSSGNGAGLREAPIESAQVISIDTAPPSYELAVVAQIPGSSCYSPAGHEVIRTGDTFRVRVLNHFTGADMCTADLGYYDVLVPLIGGFVSGTEYVVELNSEPPIRFTAE